MKVSDNKHSVEIEHKFLIQKPLISTLKKHFKVEEFDIEQTYLVGTPVMERRVRKVTNLNKHGKPEYYLTEKYSLSDGARDEYEKQISYTEYLGLIDKSIDPIRKTLHKRRCVFKYRGHKLEIDLFEDWISEALLEIEVKSLDEPFEIPDIIYVIADVTFDSRYKNSNLALY